MKHITVLIFLTVVVSIGVAACQQDEDGQQGDLAEAISTATPSPTLTPTPDPTDEAYYERWDKIFDLKGEICLNLGQQLVTLDLVEIATASPGVAALLEVYLANC